MANPEVGYEHKGSASPSALASAVDDTTLTIIGTDLSGWPTGATGLFWVTLDPDQPEEERILCAGRVGNTLTVDSGGRGADDTVAREHADGAVMWHSWSATEANQLSEHVSATSGVHGAVGDIVDEDSAQTLTNKSIEADDNTITVTGVALSTALAAHATDAELATETAARVAGDALKQDLTGKDAPSGYAGLDAGGLLDDAEVPAREAVEADITGSLTVRSLADGDPAKTLAVSAALGVGSYLIIAACKGVTLGASTSTRFQYDVSAAGGTSTLRAKPSSQSSATTALNGGGTVIGWLVVTVTGTVVTFTIEKLGTGGALVTNDAVGMLDIIKLSDL